MSTETSVPNERSKIAKYRWRMLAEVLNGGNCAKTADNLVSVRRFQSFGLLQSELVDNDAEEKNQGCNWYLYYCPDIPGFSMNIRQLSGEISAERLNGFNNTGNVCVWPSEEVMTYYCMQHVQGFKGMNICEVGGGMTCLAGVALGVCSEASHVELTDGNEDSVQNLQRILENNNFGETLVDTRLLRWNSEKVDEKLLSTFDYVLCADCLFFDEGREELAQLIFDILKPGGLALVFAPSRNNTFQKFADIASGLFQVVIESKYDKRVWDLHCKMQEEVPETYNINLHYPIMMTLTKSSPTSREITPESR
ncbi:calmodulin-lysine N-methyltransferase-like [Physella acuta]|uniref:calmodulin-lysine N-methyltransferase-like n=1 Tax=Physella acuta TaxID=109671 RepID=UPI0027DAE724|nr:calmodulin-lysine N-methyltransferase-like [Physella acuta]